MRLLLSIALCAAAFAGLVIACSGDDRPAASGGGVSPGVTPPGVDGSTVAPSDGGTDAPVAFGADLCAAMPQQGLPVDELPVHADPPEPSGGVLQPGSYVLNDLAVYTGAFDEDDDAGPPKPSGDMERSMLTVLAGGGVRISGARGKGDGGIPADVTEGFSFESEGAELVLTRVCPTPDAPKKVRYTALSGGVSIFRDATHRALYIRLDP